MNYQLFFSGIVIGISIAAPVGPIGLLCIQRTISKNRLSGLISGMGAATADMIYGSIAVFGLSYLSDLLIKQQNILGLMGGLFLIALGLKTLFTKVTKDGSTEIKLESQPNHQTQFFSDYLSTFLLTLTNPITILSFSAIYAGIGYSMSNTTNLTGLWFVLGVFIGSSIWWISLSWFVSLLRGKILQSNTIRWINIISGFVIIAFGIYALLSTGLKLIN
jgi:threonine/homoserine/homoserine lactone efflux protein